MLILPVVPEPNASRHVLDIVAILRGLGGSARIHVIAAKANGTGVDVQSLNDGLRHENLSVRAWFPYETDVATAVWSTGTLFARPGLTVR